MTALSSMRLGPGRGRAEALLGVYTHKWARSYSERANDFHPPVTILLTWRCNIRCQHCLAPKKAMDIDPDLVRSVAADELAYPYKMGQDGPLNQEKVSRQELYFSGGEPFQYRGGDEQLLLDLFRYVASRVPQIYINTNGTFLPQDEAGAISYLSQFPKNTTFVWSRGPHHDDALRQVGQSQNEIGQNLFAACQENSLGFEVNTRVSGSKYYTKPRDVDHNDGQGRSPHIWSHVNSIFAQNSGQDMAHSRPLSVADFLSHIAEIKSVGLFINPSGLLISGDHAAFLEPPPAWAVAGNLHEETLAAALWQNYFRGRFTDQYVHARCYAIHCGNSSTLDQFISKHHQEYWYFMKNFWTPGTPEWDQAVNHLFTRGVNRLPKTQEVVETVTDPQIRVNWLVSGPPELCSKILISLPEEQSVAQAQAFGEKLCSGEVRKIQTEYNKYLYYVGIRFYIKKGALSLELYKTIQGNENPNTLAQVSIYNFIQRFGQKFTLPYFLRPLLAYLESNVDTCADKETAQAWINGIKYFIENEVEAPAVSFHPF